MSFFASPFASPFGSGFSFAPITRAEALQQNPGGDIPGAFDMLLDPVSLDYVRTDNGEWAETADSRATVMIMLELELGASPFDPGDGTRLRALRRVGDPITPEVIQADVLRAGGVLVADGVISDLAVDVRDTAGDALVDESGRGAVQLHWRDLASGSPVDASFSPR